MKGLILCLGAPVDVEGNLSEVALNRLDCAINILNYNPEFSIICTGGFGQHFNLTDNPYFYYAYNYLKHKDIEEYRFEGKIYSKNTIEDFSLAQPLIARLAPSILLVLTSDFHLRRAQLLHDHYIHYQNTVFIPALSTVSDDELSLLYTHETRAIKKLLNSI